MTAAVIYAFGSVIFIMLVAAWIRYEYKRPVPLMRSWPWLAAVAVLQLVAGLLAVSFDEDGLGNVLLHGIGGGAVAALLFFYLLQTFSVRAPARLQLVALFCFVCTLGVLNELAEFAMQLAGFGIFSLDAQDTWWDFVANTSGAVSAWVLVRAAYRVAGKLSPGSVQ